MNAMMIMLAILGTVPVCETENCEAFPSSRQVYVALRNIHEEFLRSESGHDCWTGFVPLLERIVKYRNGVSAEEARNVEEETLSRFTLYSFACEYDCDAAKADFHGRLECLRLICGFGIVRSETNALFRLADWLGGASPLGVDAETRQRDSAEAMRIDALALFGGKRPPKYPWTSGNTWHLGPAARACDAKYRFRQLYNEQLPRFKKAALACLRDAVMNGYGSLTDDERDALYKEVCVRARVSGCKDVKIGIAVIEPAE